MFDRGTWISPSFMDAQKYLPFGASQTFTAIFTSQRFIRPISYTSCEISKMLRIPGIPES